MDRISSITSFRTDRLFVTKNSLPYAGFAGLFEVGPDNRCGKSRISAPAVTVGSHFSGQRARRPVAGGFGFAYTSLVCIHLRPRFAYTLGGLSAVDLSKCAYRCCFMRLFFLTKPLLLSIMKEGSLQRRTSAPFAPPSR